MTIKTVYIPAGGGFDHVTTDTTQPVEPGPGEITVVRALEASTMRPVIDRHFALDDLVAAFRHQESGKHFGKIAVDI